MGQGGGGESGRCVVPFFVKDAAIVNDPIYVGRWSLHPALWTLDSGPCTLHSALQ